MTNIDQILTNFKDYHLPIVVGIFAVGAVLQWFHHMDATFVAFTATILGAVMGQAFSPARKDSDTQSQ